MTVVKKTIEIGAPPEQVWKVIMDPARYRDWVTIHRKISSVDDGRVRKGFQVEQRLALRHAPFTVHWTLTECDAPHHGTWEGREPAHSYARVTNRLTPLDDGSRTRFDYENEFTAPGGGDGPRGLARARRRHACARGRHVAQASQTADRALGSPWKSARLSGPGERQRRRMRKAVEREVWGSNGRFGGYAR
jgi:uncharacterized protein YndB with AHSA1/START domain